MCFISSDDMFIYLSSLYVVQSVLTAVGYIAIPLYVIWYCNLNDTGWLLLYLSWTYATELIFLCQFCHPTKIKRWIVNIDPRLARCSTCCHSDVAIKFHSSLAHQAVSIWKTQCTLCKSSSSHASAFILQ